MNHYLVKEIRQTLGLTQKQYADMLGISQSYVGMIETGKRQPNDRIISKIKKKVNENVIRHAEDVLRLRVSIKI